MKLTMLGTGNAGVVKYYNTCFILDENGQLLLVDTGGGNQILSRIDSAGYKLGDIHHLFITHKHVDHFLGAFWILRNVSTMMRSGRYDGELHIYSHREVIDLLADFSVKMFDASFQNFFDDGKVVLHTLSDGEQIPLLGHTFTFFDIQSKKADQYGFTVEYAPGKRLTCLGDENYHEVNRKYVEGSEWLMHEVFCLYSDKDELKPYEKGHSTVKDVAETAHDLGVKNLILYHTEEQITYGYRKDLYTLEAERNFGGRVEVPDDLESLELS